MARQYPGKPLKLNGPDNKRVDVLAIQNLLHIQPTGIYGPTTKRVVQQWQATHTDRHGASLVPDGEVGPISWEVMFGLASTELDGPGGGANGKFVAELLRVAKNTVGTMEHPPGSNRGPEVDFWNKEAGAPAGSYWCMSWVYSMHKKTAHQLMQSSPMIRTASCSALLRDAKKHGYVVKPENVKVGDVFLVPHGSSVIHTGLVWGVSAGWVYTYEGNTNTDGSNNGIGVFSRERKRYKLKYCRPHPL